MSRERERFDDDDDREIRKKIKRESRSGVSNPQMEIRRQLLSPSSGIALNTITPCAACKLLRRRCAEECPFSPYFSPHEPQKFAAVHKVFGASNVSKMLMDVPERQRADAANCLVFEANLRLRDPVYGCMGAISALQQQIHSLQAEINAVTAEILKYKYREATSTVIDHSSLISRTGTVASIAAMSTSPSLQPPQPPRRPPPPPPPPMPPPSNIVVSSTSSSSSNNVPSLYNPPTSSITTGYSSISNDNNVPYFD